MFVSQKIYEFAKIIFVKNLPKRNTLNVWSCDPVKTVPPWQSRQVNLKISKFLEIEISYFKTFMYLGKYMNLQKYFLPKTYLNEILLMYDHVIRLRPCPPGNQGKLMVDGELWWKKLILIGDHLLIWKNLCYHSHRKIPHFRSGHGLKNNNIFFKIYEGFNFSGYGQYLQSF